LAQARAAAASVSPAGALDDPQLMVQHWNGPVDFSVVPIMIQLTQTFPLGGKLGAKSDAAAADARMAQAEAGAVTPEGWPYVQHRGGPPGFLQVLDAQTLAFPDYKGNRQLISAGNLSADARMALLLIAHARRERLKLLGRARVLDVREHPDLADRLAPAPALRKRVERLVKIEVVAFDWSCPAWITPRYTSAEVEERVDPLRQRRLPRSVSSRALQ